MKQNSYVFDKNIIQSFINCFFKFHICEIASWLSSNLAYYVKLFPCIITASPSLQFDNMLNILLEIIDNRSIKLLQLISIIIIIHMINILTILFVFISTIIKYMILELLLIFSYWIHPSMLFTNLHCLWRIQTRRARLGRNKNAFRIWTLINLHFIWMLFFK